MIQTTETINRLLDLFYESTLPRYLNTQYFDNNGEIQPIALRVDLAKMSEEEAHAVIYELENEEYHNAGIMLDRYLSINLH
jgi:hypothetical protein